MTCNKKVIWIKSPDGEAWVQSSYNAAMKCNDATRFLAKYPGYAIIVLVGLLAPGCVERTIHITSDPAGALVHLNDEEVGRTPVSVPFLFYGTYDVRLEHEGYKPLWTTQKTNAPWWETPGPDLIAEAIPNAKAEQHWHFSLELTPLLDDQELVDRAWQLRATMAQPSAGPTAK